MDIQKITVKIIETLPELLIKLLDGFHKAEDLTDLNSNAIRVLLLLLMARERMQQERVVMSFIHQRTALEKGTLTPIVDRLYKRGYVNRERDESDRRKVFVSLTPDGIQEAQRLQQALFGYIQLKLDNLSEEEFTQFCQAIDTLHHLRTKF